MREPSEKELLDGVNAKDISALRHLFEMYYAPLCFFTEKLIGRDLADDIIEDPFLKLLTENLHFESFKRLRAFLYDSAFNLCLHHIQDQPTKFNLLTEKRIKEDKELYVLKTEVVRLRALGRERA